MAAAGTKQARIKSVFPVVNVVEVSPLFMLMLMEDYEARGGELVKEPAYRDKYSKTKAKMIAAAK
jgi:hypothetical protein